VADVRVEVTDLVATVTLQRPPVNALSADMMREITAVFRDLGRGTAAAVAVLTADGDRVFCGGADVDESERRYVRRELIATETVADLIDPGMVVRDCLFSISSGALPVVAAVNGAAVGAGLALVASCDIVIASENAHFALPEINVGVLGGARHAQRLVGLHKAREMMLTGRRVSAEEAERIGLVAAVVDGHGLLPRALEAAEQIAAWAPWGIRLTKRGMWSALEIPEQAAIEYEDRQQIMALHGTAPAEAVTAFLEKRPADFTD